MPMITDTVPVTGNLRFWKGFLFKRVWEGRGEEAWGSCLPHMM